LKFETIPLCICELGVKWTRIGLHLQRSNRCIYETPIEYRTRSNLYVVCTNSRCSGADFKLSCNCMNIQPFEVRIQSQRWSVFHFHLVAIQYHRHPNLNAASRRNRWPIFWMLYCYYYSYLIKMTMTHFKARTGK